MGQKLPFLTADLETLSTPLPVLASEGDHDKHPCGGSPHHDGRQPSSHRAWMNASYSQASPSVRWIFTLCQRLPRLPSCHNAGLCLLIGVGSCLLQMWWSSSCSGSSLLGSGSWTAGKAPMSCGRMDWRAFEHAHKKVHSSNGVDLHQVVVLLLHPISGVWR
jgi:hypothetical protein